MNPEQAAAILAGIETVPPEDTRLIGWEPKHDPMECNDPLLAAMIASNRWNEIPFRVVAVSRRQWQLWEQTSHAGFWKTESPNPQTNAARDTGRTETTERIHNMKNTTTPTDSSDRKAMLTQVCDAENYLPIIAACLDDAQSKKLKPRHMANFMALSAELFISNYSMIAEAFERNNGLEIGFKARLAQEKDNVEIQFKPQDVFKDSASAPLPDEDQEEFPFVKKSAPVSPAPGPVVEAEVLALPAPGEVLALPAPADETVRSEEEQTAFNEGRECFDPDCDCYDLNPYDETTPDGVPLHQAYADGWSAARIAANDTACVYDILHATKPTVLKKLLKAGAGDMPAADFIRILTRARHEERATTAREWLIAALEVAITAAAKNPA